MQRGRIHRNKSSWFLTYWQPIIKDGKPGRKQVVKKLAPFCDQYRTKKSVQHIAEETLGPINARTARPESTQSLVDFLDHYLEICRARLRPCTAKGYGDMYKLLKPH